MKKLIAAPSAAEITLSTRRCGGTAERAVSSHLGYLLPGLGAGSAIAALGLGLVMIYRVSGVINSAQGVASVGLFLYLWAVAEMRPGGGADPRDRRRHRPQRARPHGDFGSVLCGGDRFGDSSGAVGGRRPHLVRLGHHRRSRQRARAPFSSGFAPTCSRLATGRWRCAWPARSPSWPASSPGWTR